MIATEIPLAELQAPAPGQEPQPGFAATWQGRSVTVTAVLERTAVILVHGEMEKRLARKADVLADPATIAWVQVVNPQRAYRQLVLGTPAVRAGRAREGADMGAITSGHHRFSPAEHLLTARCKGCGAGIRPANVHGLCKSCRRKCRCGGTKSEKSVVCIICSRAERAARAQGAGEGQAVGRG